MIASKCILGKVSTFLGNCASHVPLMKALQQIICRNSAGAGDVEGEVWCYKKVKEGHSVPSSSWSNLDGASNLTLLKTRFFLEFKSFPLDKKLVDYAMPRGVFFPHWLLLVHVFSSEARLHPAPFPGKAAWWARPKLQRVSFSEDSSSIMLVFEHLTQGWEGTGGLLFISLLSLHSFPSPVFSEET